MKAYAMLLGLLLTVGYGYAAQVAVSSVGMSRNEAALGVRSGGGDQPVWYGGTLDPVTVEARSDAPAKTAASRWLFLDRPAARCIQASQTSHAVL